MVGGIVMKNTIIFSLIILSICFIATIAFGGDVPMPSGIEHTGICFDYRGKQVPCKQSSGSSSSKKGLSSKNQMKLDMFESVLDAVFKAAFSPPPVPKGPTPEEIELKRQEEERKKQEALAKWKMLQEAEAVNRAHENEQKQKAGQALLSKMGSVNGGGLTPFKWEKSRETGLQFKPVGSAQSTAKLTPQQRLQCAAYFSSNAKNAANHEDARFLNEQAGKVMAGEPTNLECRFDALPEPPDPGKPDMLLQKLTILSNFQKKLLNLQDIENKLGKVKEEIKEKEDKRNSAQIKLLEAQNLAATAKPEEKTDADDLVAKAQEALKEAERELNAAKDSENDLKTEKEGIEKEIEGMEKQVKLDQEK
jgi:hypothetical protein